MNASSSDADQTAGHDQHPSPAARPVRCPSGAQPRRRSLAGAAYPIARAAPPLGLQGILITPRDEQEVRDDQGRHRARRMLAGLTRLQLHLLSDTAGMDGATDATLADLRAELHDLPTPLHPELTTVLASITLRVEVELARRATD